MRNSPRKLPRSSARAPRDGVGGLPAAAPVALGGLGDPPIHSQPSPAEGVREREGPRGTRTDGGGGVKEREGPRENARERAAPSWRPEGT